CTSRPEFVVSYPPWFGGCCRARLHAEGDKGFQFHVGSIDAPAPAPAPVSLRCFNSTLVRLMHAKKGFGPGIDVGFNSTLVRLMRFAPSTMTARKDCFNSTLVRLMPANPASFDAQ